MSSLTSADGLLERLCSTYNLNFNLTQSDFVRLVYERNIPVAVLSSIRSSIFGAAQTMGLADKRASIVSRRGTSLNPLQQKLAEDVWSLANCVSSNKLVKRIMYKNGKRGTSYIESQWERNVGTNVQNDLQVAASCQNNNTHQSNPISTISGNCQQPVALPPTISTYNLSSIASRSTIYTTTISSAMSDTNVYNINSLPSIEGTALCATATPTAALPSMSGTYMYAHNNISPIFTEGTALCASATPTAALPSMSETYVHNKASRLSTEGSALCTSVTPTAVSPSVSGAYVHNNVSPGGAALCATVTCTVTAVSPLVSGTYVHNKVSPLSTEGTALYTSVTPTAVIPSTSGMYIHNKFASITSTALLSTPMFDTSTSIVSSPPTATTTSVSVTDSAVTVIPTVHNPNAHLSMVSPSIPNHLPSQINISHPWKQHNHIMITPNCLIMSNANTLPFLTPLI